MESDKVNDDCLTPGGVVGWMEKKKEKRKDTHYHPMGDKITFCLSLLIILTVLP